MPKGLNKRPNGKMQSTVKKNLDIALKAMVDNITFSDVDRYAYYRIDHMPYDFLPHAGKVQLGRSTTTAFSALMSDRQEPLDIHLITTSIPIDVDAWREQVITEASAWGLRPEASDYINQEAQMLEAEEYLRKVTYIGVHLGNRRALELSASSVLEMGIKSAFSQVQDWTNKLLHIPDNVISQSEENYARGKEREFYELLSNGNIQAERATTEEVLLIIKRMLYPGMPAPYLDVDHENRLGPGDLELEFGHAIRNKIRYLQVDQIVGDQEMTGYRATLTLSKFPKVRAFPEDSPFIYFIDKIGLPFTSYARFTLHPAQKLSKAIESKAKEAKDEVENLAAAQDSLDNAVDGMPADVGNALNTITAVRQHVAQDKAPWIEGSYHMVIETDTVEKLRRFQSYIKQRYADLEIDVKWSAGTQAKLFLEQMPGDRVRVDKYKQTTTLSHISTSGASFSSSVGDDIKPRNGE